MELEFTKMHGLGNDFVVLNGLERDIELQPDQICLIADRHMGVGCDQILLIQASDDPKADIRYRIFNADGSEAEQCGNGARCIANYLQTHGYASGTSVIVETISGNNEIFFEGENRIRVNMGVPKFEPNEIPILAAQRNQHYSMDLSSGTIAFMALSMGNPHAVLVVEDIDQAPVYAYVWQVLHSAWQFR